MKRAEFQVTMATLTRMDMVSASSGGHAITHHTEQGPDRS